MSQTQDPLFKLLKWIAISLGVLWLGFEGYRHFAGMGPGDIAFVDGNNLFKDQQYERASEYYISALEENPQHFGAMLALANSYVQLEQYDKALTSVERAIKMKPDFGGAYAIRGIIYDHLGRYKQAMADYEKSLKMEPDVAKGMHWLDRLLYNVQEPPPTVADRLAYLQHQMALPESKRVLSNPEEDSSQRPYQR
jgi:tetratricopeptide (TPR) repeat protein